MVIKLEYSVQYEVWQLISSTVSNYPYWMFGSTTLLIQHKAELYLLY